MRVRVSVSCACVMVVLRVFEHLSAQGSGPGLSFRIASLFACEVRTYLKVCRVTITLRVSMIYVAARCECVGVR